MKRQFILATIVLALSFVDLVGSLASIAIAMPVARMSDVGAVRLEKVWGGCGPYGHRGPWGGCRRGGQWGGG
ncbi:MAG: hypothetical protein EBS82_02145, partial [Methylocystaceae bacterium]|nr:hypothetical protein [Methylocystaceae bacterium]